MQSLRERGVDRRRQQILLAARTLIGEHGLSGLTMRALADAAELSVPTVYNLIGGRDEVISSLMETGASQFGAAMNAAPREPIRRALAAVDLLADLVIANRKIVREVAAAGVSAARPRGALFARMRSEVEAAFAEARAHGDVRRGCDPVVLGARVEALAAGAVIDWVVGHGRAEHLRVDLEHGVLIVFAASASPASRDAFERRLRRVERRLP